MDNLTFSASKIDGIYHCHFQQNGVPVSVTDNDEKRFMLTLKKVDIKAMCAVSAVLNITIPLDSLKKENISC